MSKVTVLITTYCSKNFISRTIESVLAQSYKDYELVIVDDHSPDGTVEILKEYQNKHSNIRCLFLDSNHGAPPIPNNTAFATINSPYIAFLGHDDEWLPEKLQKQMKILEDPNSKIDFITCHTIRSENGKESIVPINLPSDTYPELLKENIVLCPSGIVAKKEIYDKVGFFDQLLTVTDDWDLWIRIAKAGFKMNVLNEPLVKYHIHSNNLSRQSNYNKIKQDFQIFFNKHEEEFKKDDKTYAIQLRKLANVHGISGNQTLARKFYAKAISKDPWDLKSYLYWLLTVLGTSVFQKIYSFRVSLN